MKQETTEGLVHTVSTYLDGVYLPTVMLRPVHLSEGATAYLLHQLVLLFAHHPSDQHHSAKQTWTCLFLILQGFLHHRRGFLSINWLRGNKAKIPLYLLCQLQDMARIWYPGHEDTAR